MQWARIPQSSYGDAFCMQPSFLSPLSSGLLPRSSLLINLYGAAHPAARFFGRICSFYVSQGLSAQPFHGLTKCFLSLFLNFFWTFLHSSVLWWKVCIVLVAESSCSPLQTTRGYPLTLHCPSTLNQIYWAASTICPPLTLFQRGGPHRNLLNVTKKQLCRGKKTT